MGAGREEPLASYHTCNNRFTRATAEDRGTMGRKLKRRLCLASKTSCTHAKWFSEKPPRTNLTFSVEGVCKERPLPFHKSSGLVRREFGKIENLFCSTSSEAQAVVNLKHPSAVDSNTRTHHSCIVQRSPCMTSLSVIARHANFSIREEPP